MASEKNGVSASLPSDRANRSEIPLAIIQAFQAIVVAAIAAGGTYLAVKDKDKDKAPSQVSQPAQADTGKVKELTEQLAAVSAERTKSAQQLAEARETVKQLNAQLGEATGKKAAVETSLNLYSYSSRLYTLDSLSTEQCKRQAKSAMMARSGTMKSEGESWLSFWMPGKKTLVLALCSYDSRGRGQIVVAGEVDNTMKDAAAGIGEHVFRTD